MMKNDYRRSLILLRGSVPGYSGHVRLERRTLMGSMYFMLQVPDDGENLHAALVGRGRNGYHACVIGELRREGNQATLSHSFDPRNICGRELEQYQLVAVAAAKGNDCRVVLCGNVDGHAELNWERVAQAVCLSLHPAQDVQKPDAPQPREKETFPEDRTEDGNIPQERILEGNAPEADATEKDASGEAQENVAPQEEKQEERITAGELLDVDLRLPWPEPVEELRSLFANVAPLDNPPDRDAVYIAAAVPEGSPYPYMAIGIRALDGAPVSVRYALPAAYTAEPPAGLEEYEWLGDGNRGWWITEIDLATGDRV